ncbi:MAG: ATP cone domain-containing protein [Candidatus Micrarchaeota archaeon]
MTSVIKRSGKREKFSSRKLGQAIEKAARQAKVSTDARKTMVREIVSGVWKGIKRRKAVRASHIRRMVFSRLESRSPKTMTAWRRYEKSHRVR